MFFGRLLFVSNFFFYRVVFVLFYVFLCIATCHNAISSAVTGKYQNQGNKTTLKNRWKIVQTENSNEHTIYEPELAMNDTKKGELKKKETTGKE